MSIEKIREFEQRKQLLRELATDFFNRACDLLERSGREITGEDSKRYTVVGGIFPASDGTEVSVVLNTKGHRLDHQQDPIGVRLCARAGRFSPLAMIRDESICYVWGQRDRIERLGVFGESADFYKNEVLILSSEIVDNFNGMFEILSRLEEAAQSPCP